MAKIRDPFPNSDVERRRLEYAIALREGEKRFGSPCKHQYTRHGKCLQCFRTVAKPKLS